MTPIPPNTQTLSVVALPGLHLDTLGHYFAALGLLRLTARQWPSVKGCWRDGVFHLIGGPKDFAELESVLLDIGKNNKWTPYTINRPRNAASDSPEKKAGDLSLWLANGTGELEATLALSHLAAGSRRDFNPIFGTGGNAGKRNFTSGWEKARDALSESGPFVAGLKDKISKLKSRCDAEGAKVKEEGSKQHQKALEKKAELERESALLAAPRKHLEAFLNGSACTLNPSVKIKGENQPREFISDYSAACWFSDANKKYNFSPDSPFREGQITPWAMLLACEAFPLLVGATSRQLGSAREGTGAFPFVTRGTAPENEKEVETLTGEFWAPVWSKPLSLAEVSALYKRGRAEANGRGAITSAAFAAAIIQRGTDSGLAEFRRFSLLHTTSAQTFESRLASVHSLGATRACDSTQADAVSSIISFRDALPSDGKRFSGLQGPIDTALVRLSTSGSNNDLLRENSWALLDAVFASLERTAKNKTYREREPSLELLPVSWAISLLQKERALTPEIRIALSLASLRADAQKTAPFDKTTAPFIAYRIGVVPVWKNNWHKIKIGDAAKNTPARRMLRVTWNERPLTDNLVSIVRRRAASEADTHSEPPFNTQLTLPVGDVFAFLNHEIDDAMLSRWLDRFLLFDWSFLQAPEIEALSGFLRPAANSSPGPLRFTDALLCFLRPLFHAHTFTQIQSEPESAKVPATGMLRPLIAHLERGDTTSATSAFLAAQSRYRSLLIETVHFGESNFAVPATRRLLAALLLPASPSAIARYFSRFQLTKSSNNR